ncbi:AtpZ/AtpI family protein [Acuticoccus sp. M5D2P5]|uniref:AtpZ/AtpI family protein n=1 Tax=Acuticoccus kalidii TaxID=2910977 RepID=UPI001F1DED2C|nr:AtpZ/AtpI family protein [Acuticoccus kalidii]MCF3934624.1 AtpZ/AtpI family protein [Acuticoccus kalidii]
MTGDQFDARREKLRNTLDAHKAAEDAENARYARSSMVGYAAAFRLSTEFISAIVVGLALGYLADWGLGTTPWFMIVFLLLGFVAGILNVLRSAGLIQSPQIGKRPPDDT